MARKRVKRQDEIPVYGTLINKTVGGQVTLADQVRDPDMDNMTQAEINQLNASKKAYEDYASYAELPVVGKPGILYFTRDNGYIWKYAVGSGYSLLSDNWRSIVAVHGKID